MTKSIGESIRKIRIKKGLTQSEVAQRMEIATVKISFYELDRGTPNIYTLQRLAEALECSILDIIGEPLGIEKFKCIHSDICPFYQKRMQGRENEE